MKYSSVFSRVNLPKLEEGTYVINFDKYSDSGTYWVVLYVRNNDAIYFDSFGIEHIPKEVKIFVGNKNLKIHDLDLLILCLQKIP